MKLKNIILTALMLCVVEVNAGGVPTVDAANLAAMMQEIDTLSNQLLTMKENVNMVTSTAENFIGQIEYYEDLINDISFKKVAEGYIPQNASEVLAIIKDGVAAENPEIEKTIDRIMNSSSALKELNDSEKKEVLEASRREMAFYQAAYEQSYNAATQRQNMTNELAEQSANVKNEKEARALSLAMQAQNLTVLNDIAKQQALIQMEASKEKEKELILEEQRLLEHQKVCEEYSGGLAENLFDGDYGC